MPEITIPLKNARFGKYTLFLLYLGEFPFVETERLIS